MDIVDAQIHLWEEDREGRPWDAAFARSRSAFLQHGRAMTTDRALASMDAVGVESALVTTFFLYHDISYAAEAVRQWPDRFRLVPMIDIGHKKPSELVEQYLEEADITAIRLSFLTEDMGLHFERLIKGDYDGVFQIALKHGLPVMLLVSGNVQRAAFLPQQYPKIHFIIDHLGIVQGPHRQQPARPFEKLDELLDLAAHSNVSVKLTGAPTLSVEQYPYRDIWAPIRRIIDAFGPLRVMWGSDFGRTRPVHNYAEALGFVRYTDLLTEAEKPLVLGGALRTIFNWPRQIKTGHNR